MAIAAIKALNDHGIRVPEKLLVSSPSTALNYRNTHFLR
jgi:DNA-binding LacI/PurR family transcriptional regulator